MRGIVGLSITKQTMTSHPSGKWHGITIGLSDKHIQICTQYVYCKPFFWQLSYTVIPVSYQFFAATKLDVCTVLLSADTTNVRPTK